MTDEKSKSTEKQPAPTQLNGKKQIQEVLQNKPIEPTDFYAKMDNMPKEPVQFLPPPPPPPKNQQESPKKE
jgi:hypothetical protein